MVKEFTKEQIIKKYKGALESLRDDEFIWGTVFIKEKLIELDNSNKSQYIVEIEELIEELEKEIQQNLNI